MATSVVRGQRSSRSLWSTSSAYALTTTVEYWTWIRHLWTYDRQPKIRDLYCDGMRYTNSWSVARFRWSYFIQYLVLCSLITHICHPRCSDPRRWADHPVGCYFPQVTLCWCFVLICKSYTSSETFPSSSCLCRAACFCITPFCCCCCCCWFNYLRARSSASRCSFRPCVVALHCHRTAFPISMFLTAIINYPARAYNVLGFLDGNPLTLSDGVWHFFACYSSECSSLSKTYLLFFFSSILLTSVIVICRHN